LAAEDLAHNLTDDDPILEVTDDLALDYYYHGPHKELDR
jgi:hypothetical protein